MPEQGKIVRQETLNIDASFEKKRKQADIAKKMFVAHLYSLLRQWADMLCTFIEQLEVEPNQQSSLTLAANP